MSCWPLVPLGDVLSEYNKFIDSLEARPYAKLSVKLYGKGVVLDAPVDGSTLKMRKHKLAKAGQVILSEIWGKKGAIGLVPEEGDRALCTTHFFLFDFDHDRILPGWLAAVFRANYLEEQLAGGAFGTTGYAAVRPKTLLSARVPLPPIAEQRRIVARIDELREQLTEAIRLRGQAAEEAPRIMAAEEMRVWPEGCLLGAPSLSEVTTHLARGRQSRQGGSSHVLIKTQHVQQGRYLDSPLTLSPEVALRVPAEARVRPGDVLIACSAAGCLGRVARFDQPDVVASTDTHVAIARADAGRVLPDYLYAYLRGAQGQMQLRSREKGDWKREKVGFRLTELNVADLRRVPVPIPPAAEQRRIVAYLDALLAKVDALRTIQEKTAAELDALLPAILDRAFRGEL